MSTGAKSMTRKAIQAQIDHPKLYALHQHAPIRLLGKFAWSRKATKAAERQERKSRRPYVQRSTYYGSRQPRSVVVHVYAGATVNLHNV
jgi:hypothetical protein